MSLLDLPFELITLLPQHLDNIEDFTNASSSCRTLRDAFADTHPNTLLHLAAASSRIFFRPSPYYLIAATARQLSQWALLSSSNTETLHTAFQGGIDSLFDLCVAKSGITMPNIRRLHAYRFSTLNPVSDMIDRCARAQWLSTPNFWDGGVLDAATVIVEAERSLFSIIIYGELFSDSLRAFYEPELKLESQLGSPTSISPTSPPPRRFHSLITRLQYVVFCIPDPLCHLSYPGGPNILPTGPYASGDREAVVQSVHPDQIDLSHILGCRTWREAWEVVRREIGPDFDELDWRQKLWKEVVQGQGLWGMEMLRPGGVDKWKERLQEVRTKIGALDERAKPRVHMFGRRPRPASDAPGLADEVLAAAAGNWLLET